MIRFAQCSLDSQGKAHTVSDALHWLRRLIGQGNAVSFRSRTSTFSKIRSNAQATSFEVIENKSLTIPSLLEYLEDRKKSLSIAEQYLRQIKFKRSINDTINYGFGFMNRAGGFEFSNPLGFKIVLGQKDMTYVEGHDCSSEEVFEGTPDFLTRLAIQETIKPPYDALVLNSTSTYDRATLFIISNR